MSKLIHSAFRAPSTRCLISPPSVTIGGTELLGQFFDEVLNLKDCTELWICSPFVEANASAWMPHISSLMHRDIDLNFITSSKSALSDAWLGLVQFGWRSYQFGIFDGWHAKIYLAAGRDSGRVCLTGSHNFTSAGASKNYESGTLLISYGVDEVTDVVFGVRSELETAMSKCSQVFNAVHRPLDFM